MGLLRRKVTTFNSTSWGEQNYPIYENKADFKATPMCASSYGVYFGVGTYKDVPREYDMEKLIYGFTGKCAGYTGTSKVGFLLLRRNRNTKAWYVPWDEPLSYQIIIKRGDAGSKTGIVEPTWIPSKDETGLGRYALAECGDIVPTVMFIDGERFLVDQENFFRREVDLRSYLYDATIHIDIIQEDALLLNDWSNENPNNPPFVNGWVPLITDPHLLATAVVYPNCPEAATVTVYPNHSTMLSCQGCDSKNSACTYCDESKWYGGTCGECDSLCHEGDSCPECYLVKYSGTIIVCDECDTYSNGCGTENGCTIDDGDPVTHEEEVEDWTDDTPTHCNVQGSSFDEGNGVISYCSICVGCDGCNGDCNEWFLPAETHVDCTTNGNKVCTGAACTSEQTETHTEEGLCGGCDIISDDTGSWQDEIENPSVCDKKQTSSKVCVMVDGRCAGIVNTVICEGTGYAGCSRVDTDTSCPEDFNSGNNPNGTTIKCKGGFQTDGTYTRCPSEYEYTSDSGYVIICSNEFKTGGGKRVCPSDFSSTTSIKTTTCTGFFGADGASKVTCSPEYKDGNGAECPGSFSLDYSCNQIGCQPKYIFNGSVECEPCFGSSYGTWTECTGAACTSDQTATEDCSPANHSGAETEIICDSNDGGGVCTSGIHGVCPSDDSDSSYCDGVHIPVCNIDNNISCDPCYLTKYTCSDAPCSQGCGASQTCGGGTCYGTVYCPGCYGTSNCSYTPCEDMAPPCCDSDACPHTPCCDSDACSYNPCDGHGTCTPCRICYGLSCYDCRSGEYCTASKPGN